ncbi:hypothetical protein FHS18_001106 [Paenibacillus phyllosphaerae]|uniref:Uncharacterized protein n=1 Tax=Paenibacillus phyllosphaerae TaxID=274593 RepID=A0A7W5AUL1_9BACL|nr:hypothetical protein [Paenibacillus phyllosphaerae]MBB3109054.1 hypothetical protein [Paenibacillus phyllosphaerae]
MYNRKFTDTKNNHRHPRHASGAVTAACSRIDMKGARSVGMDEFVRALPCG